MLDLDLLRANRTFRILFPVVILVAFVFLARQPAARRRAPHRVSLAELERATESLPFLTLFGRAGRYYQFRTPDGQTYFVDRDEMNPVLDAAPLSARDGAGVFVKIRGGKITAPDPQVMADWFARHGFEDPLPDASFPIAATPRRTLPVVRHRPAREPTLLVLTSDGDWSDADLKRLDTVLADWLDAQSPEADEPSPEAERPQLWYDAASSGADRKTIVVRARNFPNAWCEPLARRLGMVYPFLWQMDVGERPGPVLRSDRPATPPAQPAEAVD